MSKVKLSKTQQEVVNLMAAGWELRHWDGVGRFSKPSAGLYLDGKSKSCAANIPSQLFDKGAVEVANSDWRRANYKLAPLGYSLAQAIQEKATTTWWRVSRHSTTPEPVEVESSTDATLTINGRRTAKSSDWDAYYETYEFAITAIRSELETNVRSLESNLERARGILSEFEKARRKESK